MAVPSRRYQAGAREIKNKESKNSKDKVEVKEPISAEEHEARLNMLRSMGLVK